MPLRSFRRTSLECCSLRLESSRNPGGAIDGFDPDNPFGLPELDDEAASGLREHVERLAKEHSLEWRAKEISWLEAEGVIGEGWFESPKMRNEFDYLVALHEIGHHVLGLLTYDDGKVSFSNEVDVWEWALEEAIIEPSEPALAQVRLSLQTYPEQRPPDDQVARLGRLTSDEGGAQEDR